MAWAIVAELWGISFKQHHLARRAARAGPLMLWYPQHQRIALTAAAAQ
jgi:hypothetical protein